MKEFNSERVRSLKVVETKLYLVHIFDNMHKQYAVL